MQSQLQDHSTQQHDTSYNSQQNKEENFTEMMAQDKHGQVVTKRLDFSRSKSKGPMPTRAEALRMVSEANSEVREMKEKMAVMEQTCAQMATQMSTMMVMISSMQKSQDKQNSGIVSSYIISWTEKLSYVSKGNVSESFACPVLFPGRMWLVLDLVLPGVHHSR